MEECRHGGIELWKLGAGVAIWRYRILEVWRSRGLESREALQV